MTKLRSTDNVIINHQTPVQSSFNASLTKEEKEDNFRITFNGKYWVCELMPQIIAISQG